MTETVTVKGLLADLHAERVATMPAADLQINIDQRAELVEHFDPAATVQPGTSSRRTPSRTRAAGRSGSTTSSHTDRRCYLLPLRGLPACNIALPYYRDHLAPGLEELGVNLAAVSPQVPERLAEIVERHELPFTVASDTGNVLARRLGITFTTNEASQRVRARQGRRPPRHRRHRHVGAALPDGAPARPWPDRALDRRHAGLDGATDAEPILAAARETRRGARSGIGVTRCG